MEGFDGRLTERVAITRVGIVPAPERCQVKLSYRGKPFFTVPFELGHAEAGSFTLLETLANRIDLDRVQLGPSGDVTVLNVHYQIAQKLHACTEIPAEGDNPRVHDLYDILLLAGLAESEGLHLTRRGLRGHVRAPQQARVPTGPPRLARMADGLAALDIPDDARYRYEDARAGVEALIQRIADA